MKTFATLIATTVCLAMAPQAAQAKKHGDVVKFELLKSELASTQGKHDMLERMKSEATALCHNLPSDTAYRSEADCSEDIVTQWTEVVENLAISSAAQMDSITLANAQR